MIPGDPRVWALRHPRQTLVVLVIFMSGMVVGNVLLSRGGMFDGQVLLQADDPWQAMDHYVQRKQQEGFESEETIAFFVNDGIRSPGDLGRTIALTDAVKATFGDSVLSLSTIPAYTDDGTTLNDTPYLTTDLLQQPTFQLQQWKEQVQRDPSVYGLFVDRHFAWASVVRYLPPGHDEITEFRKTVEFLEGRQIPWWEWYGKTDIVPRDPHVGVSGWVMGRGMLDQGLNVDVLRLIFLGVGLTFPVFFITLGSLRYAVLAVVVMIACGFLATRGTMGLLSERERVFALLAYANSIVQGTSFALHKCSAARVGVDAAARWQASRSVDGLITMTGLIALFGFATLFSFPVAPIRELAVASMWGLGWLLVLALVFLPALALGGRPDRAPASTPRWQDNVERLKERALRPLIAGCEHAAMWLTEGRRPWLLIGTLWGVFSVVAGLFAVGRIETRTRALAYLHGTSVEHQARVLMEPGSLGVEFLDLLVEPRTGTLGLSDPTFLGRAWGYQTALRTLPDAREVASILSTVQHIAQESYHKPFPTTQAEVENAFTLIEGRLAPPLQRQLYFPGGVRVSVSYGFDDSVRLGRFCQAALDLAQQEFPDLRVNAFNKVPLYPRIDYYVRWGKVWNVLASQVGLTVIYWVLIRLRNRGRTGVRLMPFRGGLVMAAPLFCATALIGLVMWIGNIPLDMATASIGALTINAAGDFSLYFALTYQDALRNHEPMEALRETLHSEGTLIVADCLLNTLCFLPLLTSHFPPVRQLGWMMGVMLLACALGTLIVMAALLPRCVRREPLA